MAKKIYSFITMVEDKKVKSKKYALIKRQGEKDSLEIYSRILENFEDHFKNNYFRYSQYQKITNEEIFLKNDYLSLKKSKNKIDKLFCKIIEIITDKSFLQDS